MTETPPAPSSPRTESRWSSVLGSPLVWVLAIVFIVGLAGFGWKAWRDLERRVTELDRQLAAFTHEQDERNRQWQVGAEIVAAEISHLKTADRTDWLLAEAEYLLRLANQHAVLAHDAPAAAALLSQADRVLKELLDATDARVFAHLKRVMAIRQQIAREREALVLRSDIDRSGLYLQIDAFIQQVEKLPVIDLANLSDQVADEVVTEETLVQPSSLWDRFLLSFRVALEKMGAYVRIQHHDEALKTLLSPGDQLYLKQNLRFMLEQAQVAVLQEQQSVFNNSLSKARNWISEYYVMDPILKKKLLAELADISRHNVEEPLPDISGSLVSLKDLMKLRHQQGMGD